MPEPDPEPDYEASAYRVWRIDCPCGSVIDYDEDGRPEQCEDCGAPVVETGT